MYTHAIAGWEVVTIIFSAFSSLCGTTLPKLTLLIANVGVGFKDPTDICISKVPWLCDPNVVSLGFKDPIVFNVLGQVPSLNVIVASGDPLASLRVCLLK